MISYASFQQNKCLSELSTFRIGGPIDHFIEVSDVELLAAVFLFCAQEKLPYLIVGRGSNCIFDDRGFRGVVILNKIDFLEVQGNVFRAGAGHNFSLLGTHTARLGFSGLEFASGIPASVGGAVFMNAGANGQETCDSLVSVEFVHEEGTYKTYSREELTFSYRHSPFQQMKGAIVAATFALIPLDTARSKQMEIISYRKQTQPLSEPSCGCIFKNASISSAGALIEKAGLKGLSVGGVRISEKHANFIVNTEKGSAQDVLALIQLVKQKVKESTGVELQEEIRVIKENP